MCGFRLGYSCDSQIFTLYQRIADSLHEGARIDAIIIDFSKAFNSVPHDRLVMKTAVPGSDSIGVVWIREIPLGRSHRDGIEGKLSEEARVTSGVPQGSVIGSPQFIAYVKDIWRNLESTVGPGSVVGIATRYGLDGSNPGGGEIFRTVQTGLGAHPSSCTMGIGSFLGVKSGRDVTLTPHPLLVP